MNKEEFSKWCDLCGYITETDWNYQVIGSSHYYFIINPKTDKFALIEYKPEIKGTAWQDWYKVLVQNWIDYNGWADKFHKETEGVWNDT